MNQPISLAFTIKNNRSNLSFGSTTIKEHNAIFAQKKGVWLGKCGKLTEGHASLRLCNDSRVDPKLIVMAKGDGINDVAYIANLAGVQQNRPPAEQIPVFYRRAMIVEVWFQLGSPLRLMSSREFNSWVVVSTGDLIGSKAVRDKTRWTYFVACKPTDQIAARRLLKAAYGKQVSLKASIRKSRTEDLLQDDAVDELNGAF